MSTRDLKHPCKPSEWIHWIWIVLGSGLLQGIRIFVKEPLLVFFVGNCAGQGKIMQNLVRSKTIGVKRYSRGRSW